jgi:hypothetical protein
MVQVSDKINEKRPESVNEILQFFAARYLDERGFGYLFGQPRKTGNDEITLSSSTPTADEITYAILTHYGSQFDDPSEIPDEILDYSKPIDDEDIAKLVSVTEIQNLERETSKRIDRIKNFRLKLMRDWLENHQSNTES